MSSSPERVSSTDKMLAIACHLSIFIGFPFIIPFVIYLVKRNDSTYVAANAGEALNFHLTTLIYVIALVLVGVCMGGSYMKHGLWLPVGTGIIWLILGYILAIVAAVKCADGFIFRYPLTIRFVGTLQYR